MEQQAIKLNSTNEQNLAIGLRSHQAARERIKSYECHNKSELILYMNLWKSVQHLGSLTIPTLCTGDLFSRAIRHML